MTPRLASIDLTEFFRGHAISTGTRPGLTLPREIPHDRLYRLSADQRRRMAEGGLQVSGDDPDDGAGRLSIDQYHAMIEAGVLTTEDAIELIEGRLIRTMPINPRHRRTSKRAFAALSRVVPAGWYVTMHQPITLHNSEPQPDLAVVRGSTDDYPDHHPGPADLGLVVEVSDSTLSGNRNAKRLLYGRSGIPGYWVVNLVDRRVEVMTHPGGDAGPADFSIVETFGPDMDLPVVLDGLEVGRVAVREILS